MHRSPAFIWWKRFDLKQYNSLAGEKILFRKERSEPTFQSGVEEFWKWFPTVADRFYNVIDQGACADLTGETVDFMTEHLTGLAWSFGPGDPDGHSFTVSGEGDLPYQLLAEHWLNQSVDVNGWTFHASRQPNSAQQLKNVAISVGEDGQVDVENLLIQTTVDEEEERIDIAAWHPVFEQMTKEHCYQVLFILLDEALGEFGTQTWIGGIDVRSLSDGEQHTRSLMLLPEYICSVEKFHEWQKLPPTESYQVYELQSEIDCPRGDTVVGNTVIRSVIEEFFTGRGKPEEDRLQDSGARLAYLAIDGSVFPDGQQSDVRGRIEDAIDEALKAKQSGRVLGGAFGQRQSYVDLLLVDGNDSVNVVENELDRLKIPDAQVHFFA